MPKDYAGSRNRRHSASQGSGKKRSSGNNKRPPNRKRPRNKKQPPARAPTPGWVWMLCGLVIGALIATGGYIFTQSETGQSAGQRVETHSSRIQNAESSSADKGDLPPKVEPRFDFYKMLPNYQIVIPKKKYRDKPPKVTNPGNYMIQVGAFRKYSRADELKARLALLGLETSINKAELDGGEVWYRVRIGPESDLDKINEALKRLASHDYDSMVVRITG